MRTIRAYENALLAIAIGGIFASAAKAESALRLPFPKVFETIAASTYDENHERLGDAHVSVENVDDAHVRLLIESGIDGGPRTVAEAVLEVAEDGKSLKPIKEESRSFDRDGASIGVLSIDHGKGVASCETPGRDGPLTETLVLPKEDRVTNVPLNLLFQPLVEGTTEEVAFQSLLCRFGARIIDIDARVVPYQTPRASSDRIIEVEYRPKLSAIVSLLAEGWLPKIHFWFDPKVSPSWIAHQIPLYSKGPEVFVIRDGVPSAWFN